MSFLQGIPVEVVPVGDDCSLPSDSSSHAGRRGLCGVLFVLKLAGALAATGAPLSKVQATALHAASMIRTYGIASSASSVPGSMPAFTLGAQEVALSLSLSLIVSLSLTWSSRSNLV